MYRLVESSEGFGHRLVPHALTIEEWWSVSLGQLVEQQLLMSSCRLLMS